MTHQLQDKRVLGVEIEILTVASEQLSLYVIPSEPHTASSFLLSFSSHTGHGAFGVGSISHPDNIIIVIYLGLAVYRVAKVEGLQDWRSTKG